MKRSKKHRKPLYQKVAEEILNGQIERGNFDNIAWAIAKKLVAAYPEQAQYEMMGNGYPKMVHDAMYHAIRYLEEGGTPVYLYRPKGKIEVISTHPEYKEFDGQRIEKHIGQTIDSGMEQLNKKHPERVEWAKVKLLPYLRPNI